MKKNHFLTGLCLLTGIALSTHAQQKEFSYTINGTLKQMKAPAHMYIYNQGSVADSVPVINGHYQFKGVLNNPEIVRISAVPIKFGDNEIKYVYSFYVSKGEIEVVSTEKMRSSTVDGSGAAYEKEFNIAFTRSRKLGDSISALRLLPGFATDEALRNQFRAGFGSVLSLFHSDALDYLKTHSDTQLSPQLIAIIANDKENSPELIDSIINTLPEPYKTITIEKLGSELATNRLQAHKRAAEYSKAPIGAQAINFTQNDPDGKPVALNSYRGKYVLIDFWASWCVPCRVENPAVVQAFNKYKDRGFDVLGVSLDGHASKKAWTEAILKDKLTWTHVSELNGFSNSAALAYGVTAIPVNFLVDPKGVIIARNLKGAALEATLSGIFK